MKKHKKLRRRMLSAALSAVMICTILPFTAFATEVDVLAAGNADGQPIHSGSIGLENSYEATPIITQRDQTLDLTKTDYQSESGVTKQGETFTKASEGWSYNPTTGDLILDHVDFNTRSDYVVSYTHDLNIILKGDNHFKGTGQGIMGDGSITFLGNGTLTMEQQGYSILTTSAMFNDPGDVIVGSDSDAPQITAISNGNVDAIMLTGGGATLTVNRGSLTATSNSGVAAGCKNIIINDGDVTMESKSASTTATFGDLTFNGGTTVLKSDGGVVKGTVTYHNGMSAKYKDGSDYTGDTNYKDKVIYEGSTQDKKATDIMVKKFGPSISVAVQPVPSTDLTYGNISGNLTAEGSASDGKPVRYQWYSNATASNSGGQAIPSATEASFPIPTDLNAGSYYYYCVLQADGSADQPTDVAAVTVKKAAYTGSKTVSQAVRSDQVSSGVQVALPELPEGASYAATGAVGGTAALITGTPGISGTKLTFDVASQTAGTSATITVPVTGAKNYEDYNVIVTVTAESKKTVVITASAADHLIYNGSPQKGYTGSVSVEGNKVPADQLVYAYTGRNSTSYNNNVPPANAGDYRLVISVADSNPNYMGQCPEIDFTIQKATVTIRTKDKSASVGDAVPSLGSSDYTAFGLAGGDHLKTVPVLSYVSEPDMSRAGSAAIQASGAAVPDGGNYNDAIVYQNGTLTILPKSGGGSTGGGSGGSSSGGSSSSAGKDSENKPSQSMTGSVTVNAAVDENGSANLTVTDQNLNQAIAEAKAEAVKKGVDVKDISVVFHAAIDRTAKQITVNLPKTVQDRLVSDQIHSFEIQSDTVTIRFSQTAIRQIASQAKADVTVTAAREDSGKLTGEAKRLIGSRPMFRFTAVYGSGQSITNFGPNSVFIAIPYTLEKNEKAENIQAFYIDEDGVPNGLLSAYDSKRKAVVFHTSHYSSFAVGYRPEAPVFGDIAHSWAKDDISFAASQGLLMGTGTDTFSPDAAMTRGMFVTALGRLAGIDTNDYKTSGFTDVKASAYYAPYVEWAAQKNIVAGTGNQLFQPDQEVTREQMAVLLERYAEEMGKTIPASQKDIPFADGSSISDWAAKDVSIMQRAGILVGTEENRFDPQGVTTRAQASAVLHRFAVLTDHLTAPQGWTKDSSRHWLYYQNGTKLTGWQTIDGLTYYFDRDGYLAVDTKVDGYEIGPDGARIEK